MQRDWGEEDANQHPIHGDYLSYDKFNRREMEQQHEMSLSQLLEPTPIDPQRMVHVEKLPLFDPKQGNLDVAALLPLLSRPQQDRLTFKAPGPSPSDRHLKMSSQPAAKRPMEQECLPNQANIDVARLLPFLSIPQEDRVAFKAPESPKDQRVKLSPRPPVVKRLMEQEDLPQAKRRLSIASDDDSLESSLGKNSGKSTQVEQWNTRYQQLVVFQKEFHHCCVPLNYQKNPSLAHWVKRQRYQYRMKMTPGKHSTLTDERQYALEQLGFVWDSHAAAWEERWNQLHEFRQVHGHSRVPKNYPENTALVCISRYSI